MKDSLWFLQIQLKHELPLVFLEGRRVVRRDTKINHGVLRKP
jgi:hypothetical protein